MTKAKRDIFADYMGHLVVNSGIRNKAAVKWSLAHVLLTVGIDLFYCK